MDITKDKELVSAYKEEAQELLRVMSEAAAGLKKGAGKRARYRLFRCAHTLKEISGCMGYRDIEKIAGELLEISGKIKDSKKKLDKKMIAEINKMITVIEESL